jgi:hypothetical protein
MTKGGNARAISPSQADHFTLMHSQVDIVKGGQAAKSLGNIFSL